VTVSEAIFHAWISCRVKLISSVHDAPLVYSEYRQKASGGESRWVECMYRVWFFEVVDRGRGVELVGNMPS
jgi:hypothetical protein